MNVALLACWLRSGRHSSREIGPDRVPVMVALPSPGPGMGCTSLVCCYGDSVCCRMPVDYAAPLQCCLPVGDNLSSPGPSVRRFTKSWPTCQNRDRSLSAASQLFSPFPLLVLHREMHHEKKRTRPFSCFILYQAFWRQRKKMNELRFSYCGYS